MTILKLSSIRIDGDTQARESLNQPTVAEYAECMKRGDIFPPVTVFLDGSNYWLADGFHRYFATKTNGATDISADVKEGSQRDAQSFAMSANDKHGLRPTLADRKRSVRRMLADAEWSQWSDAEIARESGASRPTVAKMRAELSGSSVGERIERKYIHPDGKEKVMHIPPKPQAAPQPVPAPQEPDSSNDEKDQQVMEMADLVGTLTAENDRLRDAIALGQWDASDIEKIDAEEVMAELRERVRVLEIELDAVKSSRDTYQMQNVEMLRTIKAMRSKLQKLEAE